MAVHILIGDAVEKLRELPADSVHCCVTSPPYWGLRDYGTGAWEGGDEACDHSSVRRGHGEHEKQATSAGMSRDPIRGGNCRKCGARRADQQIGIEATPDEWAARLVEVFREVRRVLRPDGVCFVNVGDAYTSGGRTWRAPDAKDGKNGRAMDERADTPPGLKPKDLIGLPWLLAFALRADGWWLRDAITWTKPNPMPGSQQDRCTGAYEMVFMLSKRARYFWDGEALKQHLSLNAWPRNVWSIATEPYAESHFAVMPTALVRRCILAGTSERGCCPTCGAPWTRVVERVIVQTRQAEPDRSGRGILNTTHSGRANYGLSEGFREKVATTTGWSPSCSCPSAAPVPATVLDPFGGSGTTAVVADQLGRDAVLVELSPTYAEMAERRVNSARARRMIGTVAERPAILPGQRGLFDD